MTHVLKLFLFIFCIALSSTLTAQSNPSDNRSVKTLPKGGIQLDAIYGSVKRGEDRTNSMFGMLRYGLKNNFELQLSYVDRSGSLPLYYRQNAALSSRASDALRGGLKMYLFSEKDYFIGISAIASVNLTTNTSNSPYLPGLNFLFEKHVNRFTFQGNIGFWYNDLNETTTKMFDISFTTDINKWLDFRFGVSAVETNPSINNDDNILQDYFEFGAKLWIADGVSLYPHFDMAVDDDANDVLSLGLFLNLK